MNITLIYWIGGWLVATITGCVIYSHYNNNSNKIKIMSVRSELKKIKRMDEADRKSIF